MINTNLLKSLIIKKGLTQSDVAKKIGISAQSLSYKLNNKIEFQVNEVMRLREILDIENACDSELDKIFFANKID